MTQKSFYPLVLILFFWSTVITTFNLHAQGKDPALFRFQISGQIFNPEKEVLPYANITILPSNTTVNADLQGKFAISAPRGKYILTVNALGYVEYTQSIDLTRGDCSLDVVLIRESIELDEFVIMAQYKKESSDRAVITQSALTYIQPTSIMDALVLLPGSLYSAPSMNQFNPISFRQSGRDKNSSLGVSIVSSGAPLNSDGMRNQLYGITANTNPHYGEEKNLVFNSGLDMRMISTDHIESMSIARGISSAKSGNLSSGQINIKAKQGVTPLEIRTKIDPNVQLAYVGKGFQLPKKSGVLHLGFDMLSSTPDVREKLTQFKRITAQANHNTDFLLFGRPLSLNTKLNYTQTIDNFKSDQYVSSKKEIYKTTFKKWDLTLNAEQFLNKTWIDKLELISHLDYTLNGLDRSLLVYSDGGVNMSTSLKEGTHVAHFLPSTYKTSYKLDNRPLNLFLQLNASKFLSFTETVSQNLLYGIEYNSSKNYGRGAVINPELPPFPQNNAFIRPRANIDIPALIHASYYLESDLRVDLNKINSQLNFVTGLRATQFTNLPTAYVLNNKLLAEPRLQLNLQTKSGFGERELYSNLRFGYGQQYKMPTLDYLYPDKIYKDLEVFNWYANLPEDRLLLTHTFIHDVENDRLTANKNEKFEVGIDLSFGGVDLSLTGFKELSNSGFEYFYNFIPVRYLKYTTPKNTVVGKPDIRDFNTEQAREFISLPTVVNASKVVKKGFEYRLVMPKIEAINTNVEINGAYYVTSYSNNQYKTYYPKSLINSESYPYVGIYDHGSKFISSRLNTNLWINTHIPKLKLVFTTFVQAVWFTTSQNGREESFVPSAYLDKNGVVHAVDLDSSNDPLLKELDLRSKELNFEKDKTAPFYTVNFKGTKEIKNFGKLSFFVNNIISIHSKYKNSYQVNQKSRSTPYFGVELTFKLD